MRPLRRWIAQLRGLLPDGNRARDISVELEHHRDLYIADCVRRGMTEDEARREAFLKLGNIESAKESYRDSTTMPILEHLALDVRFAWRQLRMQPSFAVTAVLVLTLGLSTTLAILALVDGALIQPLPYPHPEQLVTVTESIPLLPRAYFSYPDYLDWQRFNSTFESIAVYQGEAFLLATPEGAQPARAARASSGFFHTLGIRMALGRELREEERQGVILSYGSWQSRFHAKPDIIGSTVALSAKDYTVVGVLPANFEFAYLTDKEFWTLPDPDSSCNSRRSCHGWVGVARLRPGTSIQQARADTNAIAARLERQYPKSNRDQRAYVMPLADDVVSVVRPVLLTLLGGVFALLLIACVNVISLLLVRAESRRREFAIRGALGATGIRLFTQVATEALMLLAVAVALSLIASHFILTALIALTSPDLARQMPFLTRLGFSGHLLVFVLVFILLASAILSFTPAAHLKLSRLAIGLAEASRGSSGKAWQRLGARLMVIEFALAMTLLVSAAFLSKSLYQLLHVELGFHPDHIATLSVAVPQARYESPEKMIALSRQVRERVQSLPGVQSVAIATNLPVTSNGGTDWIRIVGKPYNGRHIEATERDVSTSFFRTIDAKLLRGRWFSDDDITSKHNVVIINRSLADRYFPHEDPVGQQIGDTELSPQSLRTIVGVVENIRNGELDSEVWPAQYHIFEQDPSPWYFSLLARTSQNPEALLPSIAMALHKLSPDIATDDLASMQFLIDSSTTAWLHRSAAVLVGSFATVALLLGVVGLYGVVAYSVQLRIREMGIRMALGARPASIFALILRDGALICVTGMIIGYGMSLLTSSLFRKLLFGVNSSEGLLVLAVAALLTAAALAACFAPARRAQNINPADVLRSE